MKQRICLKLIKGSCNTWRETESKIESICKENGIDVEHLEYFVLGRACCEDCKNAKQVCLEYTNLEDKFNALIAVESFTSSLGLEVEVISVEDISKTKVVSDMTDLLSKARGTIKQIRKRA